MICPLCKAEGKKSTLRDGGTLVTAMYFQPYYDEEGVYHHHDRNTRKTDFSCSNGHRFVLKHWSACPGCGEKYGEPQFSVDGKEWTELD